MSRLSPLPLAILLLTGCPEDPAAPGVGDGGGPPVDGGGETALPPPAAPTAPPAVALSCPPGWDAVDGEDARTCDPWPEGGPAPCGPAEARFPGEPSCARVGAACPADGFPAGLPADRPVVYVQAGAAGGGTRAAPYGRIASALVSPPVDLVVAVAVGTYAEAVRLRGGITLQGACPEGTILDAPFHGLDPVIMAVGTGVAVRDLTVTGARSGVAAVDGNTADVQGVVVRDVDLIGVIAQRGGEIRLQDVIVRDVRARGGIFGRGLDLTRAGRITAARVLVERTAETGIFVNAADTALDLEDAVLRDIGERGINVQEGGAAGLRRVVIEESTNVGLFVNGPGTPSVVTAEDVVVRRVRQLAGNGGRALNVEGGSSLTVDRGLFEDNAETAVFAAGAGTRVQVAGAVVRGTAGRALGAQEGAVIEASAVALVANDEIAIFASGEGTAVRLTDAIVHEPRDGAVLGRGARVRSGATLSLERVEILGVSKEGILASDPGTNVSATDLRIADVRGGSEPLLGLGIELWSDTALEVSRVRLERTVYAGLASFGPGGRITGGDLAVFDTAPNADGDLGLGIGVLADTVVDLERVEVARSFQGGVLVFDGASATFRDLRIHDVSARLVDGSFGRALDVATRGAPTSLEVMGLEISNAVTAGIMAMEEGSSAVLSGVTVRDTSPRTCPIGPECSAGGMGVVSARGASLQMTDFTVADNALCGVQLISGGTMDLSEGLVSNHPIGANVQTEPFDVGRLTRNVRFVDNGVNLDTTNLPVPEGEPPPVVGGDPTAD